MAEVEEQAEEVESAPETIGAEQEASFGDTDQAVYDVVVEVSAVLGTATATSNFSDIITAVTKSPGRSSPFSLSSTTRAVAVRVASSTRGLT